LTDTQLVALITAGAGGLVAFLRWVVIVWATIRREDISAAKENATLQRADGARMVDALLAQTRSNAELAGTLERSNAILVGRIDQLTLKLDTLVEWRERTPVEGHPLQVTDEHPSERRRAVRLQTAPRGYRPPKPGGHDD